MADIELVIRIPDYIVESVKNSNICHYEKFKIFEAIKNGTSLPKGHGRIMDVDKVIKKMEEREEQLKDDRSLWETAGVETALDMFGETIIEADKAESNDDTRPYYSNEWTPEDSLYVEQGMLYD